MSTIVRWESPGALAIKAGALYTAGVIAPIVYIWSFLFTPMRLSGLAAAVICVFVVAFATCVVIFSSDVQDPRLKRLAEICAAFQALIAAVIVAFALLLIAVLNM